MQDFIAYFEGISPIVRGSIFVIGIALFWTLESIFPLFKNDYKKIGHAGLNLFLTLLNFAVGLGFAWLLLRASLYTTDNQFGILFLFDLPLWIRVIFGVILLDLIGAYFAHWTLHKVKWMWKFHVVHHSDMHVDVTSGFRHHPGEVILRMIFTVSGVLILGLPMGVIMIYQTLSLIFAQITHANVRIPNLIDRPLSYIFVTPNMHKVHHHYQQPYTDSNYGNIFGFWDRIFKTFKEIEKTNAIVYGIDTHMDPKENENMGNLLSIPFQKYREPEGLDSKKI